MAHALVISGLIFATLFHIVFESIRENERAMLLEKQLEG